MSTGIEDPASASAPAPTSAPAPAPISDPTEPNPGVNPPPSIHAFLAHSPLDIPSLISHIRAHHAGALVLFAGTTRASAAEPVTSLHYTAYEALALRSMQAIAADVAATHGLTGVAIAHRLGAVPVGEESILVAVSAPHRAEAFRGAEAALEMCKARVEVWKEEVFEGGRTAWGVNTVDPAYTKTR
ncbi:MAG: hypothetical protein M1825_003754 [Sarcosagium campestre]|nr:MAG: hypothetical protein M1825_003754 [Sarcosagium campestre]